MRQIARKTIGVVMFILLVSTVVYAQDLNQQLIAAAEEGNVAAVRELLANGADVNAKDKNGVTALMCAAWEGNLKVVEILLANGADVNAKDKYGGTVLGKTAKKGYSEIVRLLKQAGAEK